MSSRQFIDLVVKQITKETVEDSFKFVFRKLGILIGRYLPIDYIEEAKVNIFNVLFELLNSGKAASSIVSTVVEGLI